MAAPCRGRAREPVSLSQSGAHSDRAGAAAPLADPVDLGPSQARFKAAVWPGRSGPWSPCKLGHSLGFGMWCDFFLSPF
jgi:hypothetical protein